MDEELLEIMNDLQKRYPKSAMTKAEKLSIAVQIQRNRILKEAFILDSSDEMSPFETVIKALNHK